MRKFKYLPHPRLPITIIMLSCVFSSVNMLLSYVYSRFEPLLALCIVYGLLIIIMPFDLRPQSRSPFAAVTFVSMHIMLSLVVVCIGMLPNICIALLAVEIMVYFILIVLDVQKKYRAIKTKRTQKTGDG